MHSTSNAYHPARVPRPRDRLQRSGPAPRLIRLCRVLRTATHAPVAEERRADSSPGRHDNRKVRRVWDSGSRVRIMYFGTVARLTAIPSFNNSPWILGAPQNGFASDIVRIRSRSSGWTVGRPKGRRVFQLQKTRKPRRCQATTVSGLTITRDVRHLCHTREIQTQRRRSDRVSRTRPHMVEQRTGGTR
jgi:hypothetical protein